MNKLQLWQHPFVDVFKYVHLSDWTLAQKEGDVEETIDKLLGKKVYAIAGSVSAANYIQIPRGKTTLKTLGLTGKFLYFQLTVPAGKLFALHMDFSVSNLKTKLEDNLRVSISNIYRGGKGTSAVQLSCSLAARWTVLCVNVEGLLREQGLEHLQGHVLRSVTICANAVIRGVYTSDILYNPKTLPKEMAFKVKDVDQWRDFYDWVTLPNAKSKENDVEKVPEIPKTVMKMRARPLSSRSASKATLKKSSKASKVPVSSPPKEASVSETPPASEPPTDPEKPVDEFDDRDSMEPDPLLRLRGVMGYTPLKDSLHWLPNSLLEAYPEDFTQGNDQFLMCSSGPSLMLINPATGRQHILFGHLQQITCIRRAEAVVLTAQSSPPLVFVWNLLSRQPPVPIHPYKLQTISAVDISTTGTTLVIAGTDSYSRFSLQILDISKLGKTKQPIVLAKQLSDFTINEVKFEPGSSDRLVSCGKASIRFWKVKSEHLPGTSVTFTEAGRKDEFLCVDFVKPMGKSVVVGSVEGQVFVVGVKTKAVEAIFQVHSGPILSLKTGDETCVTAGSDGAVRIWPLNFLECDLDLSMSSGVVSVAFDPSGRRLACGAANATLGIMDISTSVFSTVLRAHLGPVLAIDIHPSSGLVLTTAEDKTIRIWAPEKLSQLYEFVSNTDEPISPSFHPSAGTFACGFQSGCIRIFDIESISMIQEIQQFKAKAELCLHSGDGHWLLSVCEDGTWSLLDVTRQYQSVKSQSVDHPPPYRAAAFGMDSSYFLVLGTNGTCICLWDCGTLGMKAKFMTGGTAIRSLRFCQSGAELAVVTNSVPPKLHIYEIQGYKLTLSREFPALHPSFISTFSTSPNLRYLLTTGDDKIIRVWDYHMTTDNMRCQGFLAHTGVTDILVMHPKMTTVLTVSRNDGIFVWDFLGVVGKIRPPKEDSPEQDMQHVDVPGITLEPKQEFDPAKEEEVRELIALSEQYKVPEPVIPSSQQLAFSERSAVSAIGYSPNSPASLIWEPDNGWLFHTIGTNVSMTELKEGNHQRLLIRHLDVVSHLALSPNKTVLASASGTARLEGFADIVLWDTRTARELKALSYHDKGVQAMAFSPCSNYLVSIGNVEDSVLCVWEVATGSILSTSVTSSLVHSLVFDANSLSLEFAVIGNDSGSFWRINKYRKLEFQHIEVPTDCGHFRAVAYTTVGPEHQLLIGTSVGCVVTIDSRSNTVLATKRLIQDEITVIKCAESRIVLGGTGPNLYSWDCRVPTPGLLERQPDMLLLDGGIVALSFTGDGNEGIVGTDNGTIWYVNWVERATIKIHTAHNRAIQALALHEDIFVSGGQDRTIRVWSAFSAEPISQYSLPNTECICLTFHPRQAYLLGGFADGTVRVFNVAEASSVGKCRVSSSPVTAVCVTVDGGCVLTGSDTGILSAIFIESWEPLRVRLFEFGMAGAGVEGIDKSISAKCLLACTTAGRVNVWERKPKFDPATFPSPQDDLLFSNEQSEFNLIDVFDLVTSSNALHPDQLTQIDTEQQISVLNMQIEVHTGAYFSFTERDVYLAFVNTFQTIFVRDYRSHEVIRKIDIGHYPTVFVLKPDGLIVIGTSDRLVLLLRNDLPLETLVGHSDSVTDLLISETGILSCSSAEIVKWQPPALALSSK